MAAAVAVVLGAVAAPPSGADSPLSPYTVARVGTSTTYTATPGSGPAVSGSLKAVVETAATRLTDGGGGSIRFGSGVYDLGSTWWEFYDIFGVVFEGAGIGATVITNSSSAATDTEPFDMSGADRITIRDLTVRAGGPLRSTSDAIDFDGGDFVLIERVEVSGSRARGIIFDGKGGDDITHADDNVVRDCYVHDIPGDGIELLAASRNLVEGCRITGVGGYGVRITKSSTTATQPNKPSDDNTVRGNMIDQAGRDGVFINSSNRNRITANRITNSSDDVTSRDGIRISASDGRGCNGNLVRANVATDTQETKTQAYGLNITSSSCVGTIVGSDNVFTGNKAGTVKNSGTGTVFEQGNAHPSVAAGTDISGSTTTGAALDGTVTDDGPSPLVTQWSVLDGAAGVNFDDASAVDTTARFAEAGTYTLRLTATDGAGLSAADDVRVVVHPGGTTVLAVPIGQSADDGEEREGGAVTRSSKNLELVTDTSAQVIGLRFASVQVPRGATVTSAHVQLTASAVTTATTNLQVRFQLSGNAPAISGSAFNLSNRLSSSTTPVSWSPAPWSVVGAAGPDQRTPGLAAGLQQVVSGPDWNVGSSVLVLVTGAGKRTAWSWDGNAAAAPVLHVTYTIP
ncbi:right-handed parallel beta-helix repeat-containing protein [Oryzobacter terrae]|uniref:right-handed parallel beta-helix repeat-containing protein n=1 Tax=Oryzobacter terrae TaxID=1620385 RepID=UPI003671A677